MEVLTVNSRHPIIHFAVVSRQFSFSFSYNSRYAQIDTAKWLWLFFQKSRHSINFIINPPHYRKQIQNSVTKVSLITKTTRRCYCCGSAATYTYDGYECWHLNRDAEDNALCGRCNRNLNYVHAYTIQRSCYACGATTTYRDKLGRFNWFFNYDGNESVLCHNCTILYRRKRIRKPEHRRAYDLRTKSAALERLRRYRAKHPERQKRTRDRPKEKLFHILGHICTKCKQYDKRTLEFDHINGGGAIDRKLFGHHNVRRFYVYYIAHPEEAKKRLQVLCGNCNWIKCYEKHEVRVLKHPPKRSHSVKQQTINQYNSDHRHPDHVKRRRDRPKERLFHILGHECKRCKEYDKRCLHFDHLNGGGSREYRTKWTARQAYIHHIKHPDEAKKLLQVLCVNCNRRKKYENYEKEMWCKEYRDNSLIQTPSDN